ncbi:MAG: PKD domain-containing protein [Actinobacteria bacterium]|nr:PKD domain-containing protein [Actinomycetota bacterium]
MSKVRQRRAIRLMALKSFAVTLVVIASSVFGAGIALAAQDPCNGVFSGQTPDPINKVADKSSAIPGESITYTVTWHSTGADSADVTDCFQVDDGSDPVLNALVTLANTTSDRPNVGSAGSAQSWTFSIAIPLESALVGHTVYDRAKITHGSAESRSESVGVLVTAPPPPVNHAPTVGCPTTSISDLGVDFTASGSDQDGDALTYSWNFGDGSAVLDSGSTNTAHHAYAAGGTYQVVVTVSDGTLTGASGNCPVTVTAPIISPVNHAPTVGCPTTSISDLGVDFTANGSDQDGDAVTYSWNFGDGSAVLNSGSTNTAHHAFASGGTYQVVVTVSDGTLTGSSGNCPVTVTAPIIPSIPPIPPVNLGPTVACPTLGVAGLTVDFSAVGVDPDGGSITGYHWDFGDGHTADTALGSAQHVFAADGTYQAIVTVAESDGALTGTSASCPVTVAAPVVIVADDGDDTSGETPDDTVVLAVKKRLPKTGVSTVPMAWLAAMLLLSGLLLRSAKPRPVRAVFAGRGLVATQVAQYGLSLAASARPMRRYTHRRI